MASFAITFALADTGYFLPIGKAVQKICTDEFQIHVAADKAIIKNELNTERGKKAYTRLIPKIKKVLDDCVNSEVKWTTYLFSEFNEGQEESSSELAGVTEEMVKQWIYYSALDVYVTLKIPFDYPVYKTNPLKYMERWIDINNNQASAQEEKTGNYLLGGFIDDLSNDIIDVDL
jgi:ribonucleoside-diphosphate reductase beta chain